ncbi:signal peptidase II, partial [Streptomyces sp. NPDC004830]
MAEAERIIGTPDTPDAAGAGRERPGEDAAPGGRSGSEGAPAAGSGTDRTPAAAGADGAEGPPGGLGP